MNDQSAERDSLYRPPAYQSPAATRRELVELNKIPASHRRMAWEHLTTHHPDIAKSLEVLQVRKPEECDPFILEMMANFGAQIVLFAEDLPIEVVKAYRLAKAAGLLNKQAQ